MRTAIIAVTALCAAATAQTPTIRSLRVPDAGLQPQALIAPDGTLHLLYYKGSPQAGDLFYIKRAPAKPDFSTPIRVNSQPGSAVAIGNDRGGQIALGKNNRPHFAWNGSSKAEPKGPKSPAFSAENPNNGLPMLYARLNDAGDACEPQRNVLTTSFGLDGGGSVAADDKGTVYIVFHADPAGASGKAETERRVFLAQSADEGATFSAERPISPPGLGSCGCCGLKAICSPDGTLNILFRAAGEGVNRDTHLLRGRSDTPVFTDARLHPWRLGSCPMTTFSLARTSDIGLALAWETESNIFFTPFAHPDLASADLTPRAPAGKPNRRKYPALAVNTRGQILLAWTEGMTWSREGTVHWQLFDSSSKPIDGASGQAGPVPAWSLIAAVAEPDGSFDVFY